METTLESTSLGYDVRLMTTVKLRNKEGINLLLLRNTGLFGELEHLKIKTRLIDEKFASVMGECV